MLSFFKPRIRTSGLITGLLALLTLPAWAEAPVFGKLVVSTEFNPATGTVSGSGKTGGSTSLPAIVANKDRHGQHCLGYADKAPDFVMVLQQDIPKLKIQVESGQDTTLAIKGPDNIIRCGDDTGKNKDASVEDSDWKKGEYRIWVGAINAGARWNYKLSIGQ